MAHEYPSEESFGSHPDDMWDGHGHGYAHAGNMDALVGKVRSPFTKRDVMSIPDGSHVFMLHIDAATGKAVAFEGMEWSEKHKAEAMESAKHDDLDQGYAGALIIVRPVTDEEADSITDTVIQGLDLGKDVQVDADAVVQGFRSGWLDAEVLVSMLSEAARLGRGVSIGAD